MTLTLTLTPEKETRLAERARAAGLTLDDFALRVLDEAAENQEAAETTPEGEPRTGADLLALWAREGAFLPGEPDAPARARELREQNQNRNHQNREQNQRRRA